MYSKFLSLNKEKQDKIINAALNVFSNSPYKNASTDEIVNEAGISKGSLFHYFKSKRDLYFYIFDYSVTLFITDFYNKINLNETDIFKRLSNMILVKLELIRKYPNIFNFLINSKYEEESDIKDEVAEKSDNVIMQNYSKIFGNIDKSKFKEGIDVDKAIELILFSMEGYGNREGIIAKKIGNNEQLYNKWDREINEYIDIMRKVYYKGEGNDERN